MEKFNGTDCPFCKIAMHQLPAVIIQEDDDLLAIMDLFPATRGHVLVLPKKHIENIYLMPEVMGSRIMSTAIEISKSIKSNLSPDGLNLIQSNGLAAGQTVPHFHLHIVPRYNGDPVVLRFGHHNMPAKTEELELIAHQIRSALSIG